MVSGWFVNMFIYTIKHLNNICEYGLAYPEEEEKGGTQLFTSYTLTNRVGLF